MNLHENDKDHRVAMTTRIWAMATGMLAISVGLVGVSDDMAVIPVMVIFGTIICTAIIWRSGRRRGDDMASLINVIRELQQQVARLEIESSDVELKRRIDRLQSEPVGRQF
jgi:hypothetical protein